MRHGSLFSGIGGFDLASEWMGWENVFHCEWMDFPRKVLDYYWPDADSHIDICKTDFKKYANRIDILTGGFPCQPFSGAGKRKGKDDERFLWGEMLRAIQEIKPKYVIAENVSGITSIDGGLVFEQVCIDLENEGYEIQPFAIPAVGKNAPHKRERLWFIAIKNTMYSRCLYGKHEKEGAEVWQQWNISSRNTNRFCLSKRNIANPIGIRLQYSKEARNIFKSPTKAQRERSSFTKSIKTNGGNGDVTNPDLSGFKAKREQSQSTTQNKRIKYNSSRWEQFPTESPICGGNDGLPIELDGITFSKWRAESIKGYGNAIVPQVAFELFKQLEKLNNNFEL
jgi:DNA (cytosine-5)-methyltransferase 1